MAVMIDDDWLSPYYGNDFFRVVDMSWEETVDSRIRAPGVMLRACRRLYRAFQGLNGRE